MTNIRKIFIPVILLILTFIPFTAFSADNLISADIPFLKGEDEFVARIEKKANGREPVGIVLSGGSARAFAHIGVLRRMEELGIVPDYIVANSMGSIVGLLYGAGFSPDQITEIIQSTDIGELFKIALPSGGGIINVDKFSGLLYSFTGEIDLSEMPIPVMVLCEDLRTKRLVKITEGDLSTVMRAAYALPLYFNPVPFDDYLLIDGGIANLVPLDSAYEYSDTVIASTSFYQNPKLNLKNPITNLNIALDIGKSRTGISQIKKYNPLLIRCDVESFSFMDFGSLTEIQAAGYDSADEMSEQLLALDAGGVSKELEEMRADNQVKINRTLAEYRYLESIQVLSPSMLIIAKLDVFNSPHSMRFLKDDLHFGGGIDFSYKYFTMAVTGGLAADLFYTGNFYPAANLRSSWDPVHYLRMHFDYGISLENAGLFKAGNPSEPLGSSDLFLSLLFIPFVTENMKLGLSTAGELTFKGFSTVDDSLFTLQAEFNFDSAPHSEKNYTANFILGGQLSNSGTAINFENPSVYGDLDVSIPFPGSSGLFKWKLRGFSRQGLNGGLVKSYIRDGMRTSVLSSEYPQVSLISADFVFNPWRFTPSAAELLMFKEIYLSAYGEMGWRDSMFWGSGLTFRVDLSLIGLKPASLYAFTGYDSLSSGFIGGFTIVQ